MKWKERPSPAPRETNPHETTVFSAELGQAVTLDLHGLEPAQALRELESFLNHEFMERTEVVKIIHGRGEQKLKRMVEQHLNGHPLVEYSRGSQSPSQQGAVTYAVLARR